MILRKARGMTQQKLAAAMGISHQAVSQWEKGETMPDIGSLPELARLLGTSADALLSAGEEDFGGFDEIIDKVNLVKRRTEQTNEKVSALIKNILDNLQKIDNELREDKNE